MNAYGFPYRSFSEIRIKSSEPMTYAVFNAHILRLCSNLEEMENSFTIQKASYTQWGTVRFATVDDILGHGDDNAVMTNETLNSAFETLRRENMRSAMMEGKISISKNYEMIRGDFIVGEGENIAKKITDSPHRVVYANVTYIPLGQDGLPVHTVHVDTVPPSAYEEGVKSSGIINFVDWGKPEGYTEFHVYYHKSGYVICNNGRFGDGHKQIRVDWTLLMRKDNL